jgi:hypothetical protein
MVSCLKTRIQLIPAASTDKNALRLANAAYLGQFFLEFIDNAAFVFGKF